MKEIFNRLTNSLLDNETVILSTPYVSKKAREQSYKLIKDMGEKIRRKINAVIVTCECDEALSKERMSKRPVKDVLHCAPNNQDAYDRVKKQNEPISKDEIDDNPNFSFLIYDTKHNQILRREVRNNNQKAIKSLESILLK